MMSGKGAKAGDKPPNSARERDGLAVTFWGVRGTAPVSGRGHLGFGGETICVDVSAGASRVIVDAGSGLAALGRRLAEQPRSETDIVLSHFHLDHLLGFMSFSPLYQPGSSVRLHAPILEGVEPEKALAGLFDRPFFPMSAHEAGAAFSIQAFTPGDRLSIGGFSVATCALSHPGGACGYRIEHAGRAVVVALDHEHGAGDIDRRLEAFCSRADLVLYDATWDERVDYEPHRGWGHSTWQAGLELVQRAGAGRLACLHHAPSSNDRVLIEREKALQALAPQSFFARQDQTHVLP